MALSAGAPESPEPLTPLQRFTLRKLRRRARKQPGEPLEAEDWAAYWALMSRGGGRFMRRLMGAMPASPRCSVCLAPFRGLGHLVVGPLGYRPSRKNPQLCATCVELSPPGGMAMPIGVLFADIRGFTAHSEGADPAETVALLRRFYACAERVLFPEALIDKLIGDEVMALYLPELAVDANVGDLMLGHARALLEQVGYGSDDGPFVELGIGLDFGDAFVGNIGDRAVYDFTAVGDVVNTANRLQHAARGGEIVYSKRVAVQGGGPSGDPIELTLKGKAEVESAFRLAVGSGR